MSVFENEDIKIKRKEELGRHINLYGSDNELLIEIDGRSIGSKKQDVLDIIAKKKYLNKIIRELDEMGINYDVPEEALDYIL